MRRAAAWLEALVKELAVPRLTTYGVTNEDIARVVAAARQASSRVSVWVLGSGDVVVFARNAISVASQGSGEITIVGKPAQRSVSITGSGGVRWE